MSLAKFVEKARDRSLRWNAQEMYEGIKRRVSPKQPYGPSVYTRDWDILILLDTCRPDHLWVETPIRLELSFHSPKQSSS